MPDDRLVNLPLTAVHVHFSSIHMSVTHTYLFKYASVKRSFCQTSGVLSGSECTASADISDWV